MFQAGYPFTLAGQRFSGVILGSVIQACKKVVSISPSKRGRERGKFLEISGEQNISLQAVKHF